MNASKIAAHCLSKASYLALKSALLLTSILIQRVIRFEVYQVRIFYLLTLFTITIPAKASDLRSKDALLEEFEKFQKDQSIYSSAPLTHINPKLNNITYALSLDIPSFRVGPDIEDPSYYDDPTRETSLSLSGWSVAPHLAVSLKNIGLGFSVGRSERKSKFLDRISNGANIVTNFQSSTLTHGDFGFFIYFVPFKKISKKLRMALILGGKSINVKHSLTPSHSIFGTNASNVNSRVYRYNVHEISSGLNIKFQLLQNFTLIPWADYKYVDTAMIDSTAKDLSANASSRSDLERDIELFWHSQPKLRYGIDISVRFKRLEINLGGLFGALALSATDKKSIEDNAITINFALHQKDD